MLVSISVTLLFLTFKSVILNFLNKKVENDGNLNQQETDRVNEIGVPNNVPVVSDINGVDNAMGSLSALGVTEDERPADNPVVRAPAKKRRAARELEKYHEIIEKDGGEVCVCES